LTGERGQQGGPPAPRMEPAQDGPPAQDERLEPIVAASHRKDDGRALILYTRPHHENS
jgi:hypothetical protein